MAVEHMTVTREEIREELDASARQLLGLSADQFVTRYCHAELDLDSPAVLRLSVLARLLLETESKNGVNGHRV
jgi:hypothetical protein